MKNWKIIAIIALTAVSTAAAVAFVCQKLSSKRRLRFDSSEFDEKDYAYDDEDFEYGEQCSRCEDLNDLDVQIPDETDAPASDAGSLEEAAEIEQMLGKAEEEGLDDLDAAEEDVDTDDPQEDAE